MSQPTVIAVAGVAGVGKTTWLRQQLAQAAGELFYFCPGAGAVPIDATCVGVEFPNLTVLVEGQESQLWQLPERATIYIELGAHLDLASLSPLLDVLTAKRVAIVSPAAPQANWQDWADIIVEGANLPSGLD